MSGSLWLHFQYGMLFRMFVCYGTVGHLYSTKNLNSSKPISSEHPTQSREKIVKRFRWADRV